MMRPLRKIHSASVLLAVAAPALAHITEQVELVHPSGSPGDRFGFSVGIEDVTVVVGAPYEDSLGSDAGGAHVFVRNGLSWSHQAELLPLGASARDHFGWSVSISGDTVVVGAPEDDDGGEDAGAAYVFVRTGTTWSQQAKLTASDAAALHSFGLSVAVLEDTIVVGAPSHGGGGTNAGAAYVFVRSGTLWTEQAQLLALDAEAGDVFGLSVSISHDDLVAVGAPLDDDVAADAGSAYVFERSGTTWTQDVKLLPSDGLAEDLFGKSVAIHDERVLVGSPQHDSVAEDSGSMYAYDRTAGVWSETYQVFPPLLLSAGDRYGGAVALDHHVMLVGARLDGEEAPGAGKAYSIIEEGGTFDAEVLVASEAAGGDELGSSVDVSECWGVLGAPLDDTQGVDAGSAYVYTLVHDPETYCTAGTSASGCRALISAAGFPSASAPSGFTLSAAGVEGDKFGLFYFGTNGRAASPWGNGTSFQCVVPPVSRAGTLTGTGTPGQCDGSFSQDLNALWCPTCPKPAKNPGAGAVVQAQLWYRDPLNTSNQSTSLSDAVEFEVCP